MTSADIVHEFQAYSHLGEKGGGGWGGTLIFSNIRRPGPFLGLTFWYFVMTPKDIHKIFIPQKIFIFLKTLKGIEIQNFEPQNGASLRMNATCNFLFFYLFIFFFWGGGGVGGVQILISIETYITCDFSGGGGGGGGVRTTYPSLDSRMGKK